MIKFNLIIRYNTEITLEQDKFERSVEIENIKFDERYRHKFFQKEQIKHDVLILPSLKLIFAINNCLFNQLMFTEVGYEDITMHNKSTMSKRYTHLHTLFKQSFVYTAMEAGYTSKTIALFLGYSREHSTVRACPGLFNKKLMDGQEEALILWKANREVLNKLSTNVNLYKDE